MRWKCIYFVSLGSLGDGIAWGGVWYISIRRKA
jgi:hypothetical protein